MRARRAARSSSGADPSVNPSIKKEMP